jgi:hypothetical protein
MDADMFGFASHASVPRPYLATYIKPGVYGMLPAAPTADAALVYGFFISGGAAVSYRSISVAGSSLA